MRRGKFGTVAAPEVAKVASDPFQQRFLMWKGLLQTRGLGKAQAEERAAFIACMNRRERRRFVGERGKNRDLPRLMKVPRG